MGYIVVTTTGANYRLSYHMTWFWLQQSGSGCGSDIK